MDCTLERQSATALVKNATQRSANRLGQSFSTHNLGATLARDIADDGFAHSNIEDKVGELAQFSPDETLLGRILGRGSFGTVYEARAFDVPDEHDDDDDLRSFLAKHCVRETTGEARYAVKCLSKRITSDAVMFPQALLDMAYETRYMSALVHPNICKIRAVSSTGPFDKDYFIVLDRLYDTLEDRIMEWKKDTKRKRGRWFSSLSCAKNDAVAAPSAHRRQQLRVAYGVSSAIECVHKHNIVYRDLKPQNLGFDIRNDIKLFDFGIARECRREDRLADGTYKLTVMTGSPRYMAPEVANSETYNERCDCYSFAILLWELFSLKTPFKRYDGRDMFDKVWNGPHLRPSIPNDWPYPIRHLIKRAWSWDYTIRPDMSDARSTLRLECLEEDDSCDEDEFSQDIRRSTFVYRHENRALIGKSMDLRGAPSMRAVEERERHVDDDDDDSDSAYSPLQPKVSFEPGVVDTTERTHIAEDP